MIRWLKGILLGLKSEREFGEYFPEYYARDSDDLMSSVIANDRGNGGTMAKSEFNDRRFVLILIDCTMTVGGISTLRYAKMTDIAGRRGRNK